MPAIPASTQSSLTLRLLDHAEQHWPQLQSVEVTYHGAFAYITGVLHTSERIPLCRLRYGGSAHSFGFAIYSAAHDRYEDSVLRTGFPAGRPQEALDTACTIHVAELSRARPVTRNSTPDELTRPPHLGRSVRWIAGACQRGRTAESTSYANRSPEFRAPPQVTTRMDAAVLGDQNPTARNSCDRNADSSMPGGR